MENNFKNYIEDIEFNDLINNDKTFEFDDLDFDRKKSNSLHNPTKLFSNFNKKKEGEILNFDNLDLTVNNNRNQELLEFNIGFNENSNLFQKDYKSPVKCNNLINDDKSTEEKKFRKLSDHFNDFTSKKNLLNENYLKSNKKIKRNLSKDLLDKFDNMSLTIKNKDNQILSVKNFLEKKLLIVKEFHKLQENNENIIFKNYIKKINFSNKKENKKDILNIKRRISFRRNSLPQEESVMEEFDNSFIGDNKYVVFQDQKNKNEVVNKEKIDNDLSIKDGFNFNLDLGFNCKNNNFKEIDSNEDLVNNSNKISHNNFKILTPSNIDLNSKISLSKNLDYFEKFSDFDNFSINKKFEDDFKMITPQTNNIQKEKMDFFSIIEKENSLRFINNNHEILLKKDFEFYETKYNRNNKNIIKCINNLDRLMYLIITIDSNNYNDDYRDKIEETIRYLSITNCILNSPNILKYFFSWEESNFYFIKFEDAVGNLNFLQKTKFVKFHEKELKKLIFDVIKALKSFHKLNISHLKINPDNIYYGNDKNYKISELNIFFIENKDYDNSARNRRYYSPELFENKQNIDYTKCDIYSLGVIIYDFIFNSSTDKSNVLFSQENIKNLNKISDKYSSSFIFLLENMLHPNPNLRPDTTQILKFIDSKFNSNKNSRNDSNDLFKTLNRENNLRSSFC